MSNDDLSFETIIADIEGPVVTITINRPGQLNALNLKVLEEIYQVLMQDVDDDTRVVVFKGSGDKAFVAGADVSEMSELTPEAALAFARAGHLLLATLEKMPQIIIAQIQGFALGGGCELAMGCDIIIAGKRAQFGQPEVNLGLIPGFGGTQRLVHRVGLPMALDLICTGKGRTLSAEEALQAGLISRVVANEQLEAEVKRAVASILEAAPTAVIEAKRLCREAVAGSLEAGLSSEATSFALCFSRDESREGIDAFLNKRKPEYT